MTDTTSVTVFGFPRSTYVKIVQLVLEAKGVPYRFHDTETEMYLPAHRARHPFGRVPVLQHGDFMVYETAAIATYIDQVFDDPKLIPSAPRDRARVNQWISALNAYFYPYMIFHVAHERLVFPELGVASDEGIVARGMTHVREALGVMQAALDVGERFLVGNEPTMADLFLYPSLFAFALTPEGKAALPDYPKVQAWRARMDRIPVIAHFNAKLPPRQPIEHAREWAVSHRPGH
jgi:glutathione S-transferase